MIINYKEDGISHINIYSKSLNELGYMLSNFYKYPIKTYDGKFMSVEAYWYWLSINDNIPEKEELRNLYGFSAKSRGEQILKFYKDSKKFDDNFENKILAAIWYKFKWNKQLIKPQYYNLPFYHYYRYNDIIIDVTKKYQWMVDGITEMRDYLIKYL